MQFTRLRLTGFKSFVDPTEFHIDPGLTGIVGPNGCGKSNLLEGLRWVMGETKPTNVRGEGMDDVIFAGTASRSPRNLADVTILLDNTDLSAPAEFNGDDVIEISRRIERESGSAYRINGREVRARDVQILFADLATGAHSPALVSQGRVGALINAKPKDRRGILEEAAGIGGLHTRRHEAELRLNATETNLERLRDMIGELEAQLAGLKRQARQAARYRTLSDRLRQAEAMMMLLRWRHAREALDQAKTELSSCDGDVAAKTATAASASTAQALIAAELPALRDSEAQASAGQHRLTVERDALDAEEQRLRNQENELAVRIEQTERDLEREQSYRDDAGLRLETLGAERKSLNLETEAEQAHNSELEEQLKAASSEARDSEADFEKIAQGIATTKAEHDALSTQVETAGQRISSLTAALEEAEADRQKNQSGGAAETQIEQARKASSDAEQRRNAARASMDVASDDSRKAAGADAAARTAFQDAKNAVSELEAEERALANLLESGRDERFAPVIDQIRVDRGYEAALGAAFGEDLELPAEDAASAFWADLPRLHDAPALPMAATQLSKYVAAPAFLERALSQIGLVDSSFGSALQKDLKPGQMLVSENGGCWRWDGRVTKPGSPTTATIRLEQRNRLAETRTQTKQHRARLDTLENTLRQAEESTQAAVRSETECREALALAEEQLAKARDEEASHIREAADANSTLSRLAERIERLNQDLSTARGEKAQASQTLSGLDELDQLNQRLDTARGQLEEKREALTQCRAEHDARHLEAQARYQRLNNIESEFRYWTDRIEGAATQIEDLDNRLADTRSKLEAVKDQPLQITQKRDRLNEQIALSEQTRQKAAAALAEAESTLSERDRALRVAEQALSEAREQRVRTEAAVEQAEERRSSVIQRMDEVLECGPDRVAELAEYKEGDELPDLEATSNKLERLKRERENMGPVNLRAEIEAEEIGTRAEDLTREMGDLEEAIGRLRRAIGNLNREGRERMLTAFAQVNEHFTDLFKRLFGGGDAHLSLTESDDPLDAGLEIMASPPGKRLQHMSLLSGGEQALTALALIFAVFLTNPAPICVLDEVDAPLDDANVERFCDLLTEITRTTQTRFLVVTHNPITMSRLDRLYGVTMGERGVSQLVSVDLGQAEQLVAAE